MSCVYLCKDTNLKAIHNRLEYNITTDTVVFTYAKIQIWKQFTTYTKRIVGYQELCLPMQRYKFESNSQLDVAICKTFRRCVYLCKDTNLKAIHNDSIHVFNRIFVVFTYAKIQIWKQFTTMTTSNKISYSCVYLCKDTNLKAIHNYTALGLRSRSVVFTYAKIQIWKQFTTDSPFLCPSLCCVYLCKDTNLKAIHNKPQETPNTRRLCLPMQRYKFESDSQPSSVTP